MFTVISWILLRACPESCWVYFTFLFDYTYQSWRSWKYLVNFMMFHYFYTWLSLSLAWLNSICWRNDIYLIHANCADACLVRILLKFILLVWKQPHSPFNIRSSSRGCVLVGKQGGLCQLAVVLEVTEQIAGCLCHRTKDAGLESPTSLPVSASQTNRAEHLKWFQVLICVSLAMILKLMCSGPLKSELQCSDSLGFGYFSQARVIKKHSKAFALLFFFLHHCLI